MKRKRKKVENNMQRFKDERGKLKNGKRKEKTIIRIRSKERKTITCTSDIYT